MLHALARRPAIAPIAIAAIVLSLAPTSLLAAQTTSTPSSNGAVVHPLRIATEALASGAGVHETRSVWIRMPASMPAAMDVELVVEPTPALLSVTTFPARRTQVAPGEFARFQVGLESRPCFVDAAFTLVFRDPLTGIALGDIDVDVARGVGETPRDLKESALFTLEEIRAEIAAGASGVGRPEKALEELEDAIEELIESLEPRLWADDGFGGIDPLRLDPHRGAEVFHEERESAQEVFDAIRQGEIHDAQLTSDLIGVIDALVFADRGLAEVAIEDASVAGGDPEELEDALETFAEGDALVANADLQTDLRTKAALLYTAMDGAYRHAWSEAIDAHEPMQGN